MAEFFCEQCNKLTEFLPIHYASQAAGVSRSTMHYWIKRDWVHGRKLPSGRTVICRESLSSGWVAPVHADFHRE